MRSRGGREKERGKKRQRGERAAARVSISTSRQFDDSNTVEIRIASSCPVVPALKKLQS